MINEQKLPAVAGPIERRVMRHYAVQLTEAHEPRGVATANIRGCMCCGMAICGMGGGGNYLCQYCLDKMHRGEMAEALYLLARQREKDAV